MQIKEIVLLLGGVALFLFGMDLMGDGLKKVAGSKLELILYRLSDTRLKGILLGTGVTAVIQSSSATSVMTIGFVNSGMMQVGQAISVILGAILGTSVTGWVICLSEIGGSGALSLLSTDALASFVAIAGILVTMIAKKKAVRQTGGILLGFAVLMFGMKTMSGAVSGLKESPQFMKIITGFSNPVLGVLIGIAAAAVLQSASAAVGILQALSGMKVITYATAIPIILGIAVGASVPVLISAVGATVNGRRTAFSYPVIEILRAAGFALVFYALNAFCSFGFMEEYVTTASIAAVNTGFRLVTVAALAPFVGLVEKIVTRLVPEKGNDEPELAAIRRLEERFQTYPPLAVEHSRQAIMSMAQCAKTNYYTAIALMTDYSEEGFNAVEKAEGVIDKYEDAIGRYLMGLISREIPEAQTQAVGDYLHAITDLERIGDHALNLAESFREMDEKKAVFSEQAVKELRVLMDAVGEMIDITAEGFEREKTESAYRAEALEEVIDDLCDEIKLNHVERLMGEQCSLQNGYILNDLLTNFERISDHCRNIAVALIVKEEHLFGRHEYSDNLKKAKTENMEKLDRAYREKYVLPVPGETLPEKKGTKEEDQ